MPGIGRGCLANLSSVYTVGPDGSGERCLTGPISGGPGSKLDGFPNDESLATVENGGNLTATGVKLTLRLDYGRGRILPPLPSCSGTPVVTCDLPPLAAGGSTQLVVAVANPKPVVLQGDAGSDTIVPTRGATSSSAGAAIGSTPATGSAT